MLGVSVLLYAVANIQILFNRCASHLNVYINNASSYLLHKYQF